nr:hypothetical protein [Bacteroidota bacterium]
MYEEFLPYHLKNSTNQYFPKKYIFICWILILVFTNLSQTGCVYSQTFNDDCDLKKMNLFGQVKSIKTISYAAKDYFGKIIKCEKSRYPLVIAVDDSIIFNKSGYTDIRYRFSADNTAWIRNSYKYDKNSNLLEETEFFIGKIQRYK